LYLSAFNSKKIGANPKVIEFYDRISKNALPLLEETDDEIVTKDTPTELKDESYDSKNVKVIKF